MLLIGENVSTQVMVANYFNELRICEICKIKEKIITKKLVELGNCTWEASKFKAHTQDAETCQGYMKENQRHRGCESCVMLNGSS